MAPFPGPRPRAPRSPDVRLHWTIGTLLVLITALAVAFGFWSARGVRQGIQASLRAQASAAADQAAMPLANRFDQGFETLRNLVYSYPDLGTALPSATALANIATLPRTTPGLLQISEQTAGGQTLWSTGSTTVPATAWSALNRDPSERIGPVVRSGSTLGVPVGLTIGGDLVVALMRLPSLGNSDLSTSVEQGGQTILGWSGTWTQMAGRPPALGGSVTVTVPGYAWSVRVGWTVAQAQAAFWRAFTRTHLPFEAARWLLVVIILLTATSLIRGYRGVARHSEHLASCRAVQAEIGDAARSLAPEGLLQRACLGMVREMKFAAAWVALPNGEGGLRTLAHAGGQAPSGPVAIEAWLRQARARFGTTLAVPVGRGGTPWGVLCAHRDGEVLAEDGPGLEILATTVGQGLDAVDARQWAQAMFELNAAGIATIDDHLRITDVNPTACSLTGYDRDELIGQHVDLLQRELPPTERVSAASVRQAQTGTVCIPFRLRRKDGDVRWVEAVGGPIDLRDGRVGQIWSIVDVTSTYQARDQLKHQALHDPLTGLPNRRALDAHLSQALTCATESGRALAVGFLDLDDFKPVNDQWGHDAGDRLLQDLAGRLRGRLRVGDTLARLGGDEFIIVLEDLDPAIAMEQCAGVLDRLHESVETPFDLGGGSTATVGMSLGLALFPSDASDGDALVREADAALYRAKAAKVNRRHWWSHRGVDQVLTSAAAFDPFGPEATELLARNRVALTAVVASFLPAFALALGPVVRGPEPGEHLRTLLDPATTAAFLEEHARSGGELHAMIGVTVTDLLVWLRTYRRVLVEEITRMAAPVRDRTRILQLAERRLGEDMQSRFAGIESTLAAYFEAASTDPPPPGTAWQFEAPRQLAILGALPGIRAALLLRAHADGTLLVEHAAGPAGSALTATLNGPEHRINLTLDAVGGQALAAEAWRSLEMHTSPSLADDPRYAPWAEQLQHLGLRSLVSIPIAGAGGPAVAILSLISKYPGQFETPRMRQFTRRLRQGWEEVWKRCGMSAAVLSLNDAAAYRKLLYDGGLRMFAQPVIALNTAQISSVEALARLQSRSGEIISPGMFLPSLGQDDLDILFREGMTLALGHLARWDREGLETSVAVNLPPSTLRHPGCPHWVAEALREAGVAPGHLILEILETETIDLAEVREPLEELQRLGVRLALDDIGAGYSNWRRLMEWPFSLMKLDREMVQGLDTSPVQTMSILTSLVQLGQDMGREVVVEGIEDAGVLEAVTRLGSRFAQGNALGSAMPAEDLVTWARDFVPSATTSGPVHTMLGALAVHWRLLHSPGGHTPYPLEACPVQAFLTLRGLRESEGARWHAQLHSHRADVERASRALSSWLVGQSRKERGA